LCPPNSGVTSLVLFIFSFVYYTTINPKTTSEILDCRAQSCELMYFDKTGLTYRTAAATAHKAEFGLGRCVFIVGEMVKEWDFPTIIGLPPNENPASKGGPLSLSSPDFWSGRRGGPMTSDPLEVEGPPKFSFLMSQEKKEAAERKREARNEIIERMMAREEERRSGRRQPGGGGGGGGGGGRWRRY